MDVCQRAFPWHQTVDAKSPALWSDVQVNQSGFGGVWCLLIQSLHIHKDEPWLGLFSWFPTSRESAMFPNVLS